MLRTLVLCLALACPSLAWSFDSLEDVACVCAQDVINQGDYVSCVSHLSRRLVAKDAITKAERSEAVSAASGVDYEALQAECDDGTGLGVAGWGVSLESDSPFYSADPVTGEPAVATLTLRQWNFTEADAFQFTQNGIQFECQFELVVKNRVGGVVHRGFPTCGRTFHDKNLFRGESEALAIQLPMSGLNAETGLFDGEALPPGIYRVEVTWIRQGPQDGASTDVEGGRPFAGVAVRVLAD